jgi:hypothetical protein
MSDAVQAIRRSNTQSKVIMSFILVLALSGLENLIAEVIPELEIGPLEIGISSFFFVPLVLVILFNNWWAALAAPIGEIIFSDLVLGEFGGLGEFEEVILVTIALMLAAYIAKNPKNGKLVLIAGLVAYLFAELSGTLIDIAKVWIGVEEFEAVEGLPQSIVVVEGLDFLIEYVITGVLLGAIPAMWLAPRLHGKLEPLMGLKPRSPEDKTPTAPKNFWIIGAAGILVAGVIAVVSEMGFNIVEWEGEFLDTIGAWWIWVAIALATVVAAAVIYLAKRAQTSK